MSQFLLLLLVFISTWCTVYSNKTFLVINGEDAPEGRWPFMVSLQSNGRHFCGGSILNDDSVLTAAHCVLGKYKVADTKAIIGSVKNTNPDSKYLYQAKQFIANPKFSMNALSSGNDVAVIKLDRKIDFKQLKGKVSTPANLKLVDLPIMPESACSKEYDRKVIYCAGFKNGKKGTCSGDSGSPVVCPSKSDPKKYLQYGITSYGNTNCSSFGYYNKPAAFLDFIRENDEK